MSLTDEEVAYLRSQRLARIATVSADGQPDVVPVGFQFDGTHFHIGGFDRGRTRRSRNVEAGNSKVALVVDDLASTDPRSPRYVRAYGTAELVDRQNRSGQTPIMKNTPTVSWRVDLTGQALRDGSGTFTPRRAVHTAPSTPDAGGEHP